MDKFLSRQQVKVIIDQAPKNVDGGKLIQGLVDRGYKLEGFNDQPVAPVAQDSTIGSRVTQDIQNRGNTINDQISGQGEFAGQSPIRRGAEATATAFGAIPSTAVNLLPEGARNVVNKVGDKISQGFNFITDKIGDSPALQKWIQENPEAAKKLDEVTGTIAAGGAIAGTILAVEGAAKGGQKVVDTTVKTAPKVAQVVSENVKKLTTQSEKQIESAIINKFNKGVKPSVAGKGTASNIGKYNEDVVSAVKSIKDNTGNLTFTDEFGEVVTGKTPKSLKQLSESVEQTKKNIFNQYDNLAKEAGDAGVGVEMTPIATELDAVIGNKALSITNPKAIEYAKQTKQRIANVGKLDATTAQEVVQNYNKSLEAFYKNPTYDTASNAAIDAMLANRVRQSLDEGISGLTGKQYSALKKQYGSLKSIEKDVVKATLRDARKNTKGLIDFSDVLSGGQVVNGILSLSPGQVASGLTQKAIAEFYKYLNNPNRAIEKMFESANKLPVKPSK